MLEVARKWEQELQVPLVPGRKECKLRKNQNDR